MIHVVCELGVIPSLPSRPISNWFRTRYPASKSRNRTEPLPNDLGTQHHFLSRPTRDSVSHIAGCWDRYQGKKIKNVRYTSTFAHCLLTFSPRCKLYLLFWLIKTQSPRKEVPGWSPFQHGLISLRSLGKLFLISTLMAVLVKLTNCVATVFVRLTTPAVRPFSLLHHSR